MNRYRHIGFIRILPEYLLIFGLLFGGFTLAGSLSEAPVSHTEVAYIELLVERAESTELGLKRLDLEATSSKTIPLAPFYTFTFHNLNQTFLVHHLLAREKERSQATQLLKSTQYFSLFSHLHIPLYPQEDFSIPIAA